MIKSPKRDSRADVPIRGKPRLSGTAVAILACLFAWRWTRGEEATAAPALAAAPLQAQAPAADTASLDTSRVEAFPGAPLFAPLLGDPRWPRLSVGARRYLQTYWMKSVATVDLGSDFPLVRWNWPHSQLEAGIQGGAFCLFNIGKRSADLEDIDFNLGLPISYRYKRFFTMFRPVHRSTHLGDEYLVEHGIEVRKEISYEYQEWLLAYLPSPYWRLYGGPAWILLGRPEGAKPWSYRWGVEYRGASTLFGNRARPIAAVDLSRTIDGHNLNLSARMGIEFLSSHWSSVKLQFLVEYYRGASPDGQFYLDRVEYGGGALRFCLQ